MTGNRARRHQRSDPVAVHLHAVSIAEAVDATWHRTHGISRYEIPLGVVAALALLGQREPDGPDLADQLTARTSEEFAGILRTVWRQFVTARPDLIPRLYPLFAWLWEDPSREVLHAAKATADAALCAGQLDLTGVQERRRATDFLGAVLSQLTSRTARSSRGQFYTPDDVATAIGVRLAPEEGASIHEPAAGTGGMFRAAAQSMRSRGLDPATVTWTAVDIDELAIAGLAVNTALWDLGTRVLLGVGDSLTDDWMHRARAERDEALEVADWVYRVNRPTSPTSEPRAGHLYAGRDTPADGAPLIPGQATTLATRKEWSS